jgi:hypothetical protein
MGERFLLPDSQMPIMREIDFKRRGGQRIATFEDGSFAEVMVSSKTLWWAFLDRAGYVHSDMTFDRCLGDVMAEWRFGTRLQWFTIWWHAFIQRRMDRQNGKPIPSDSCARD